MFRSWRGHDLETSCVMDEYCRECLAIGAAVSIRGLRVTRIRDASAHRRGYPRVVVSDNGPEFTGRVYSAS